MSYMIYSSMSVYPFCFAASFFLLIELLSFFLRVCLSAGDISSMPSMSRSPKSFSPFSSFSRVESLSFSICCRFRDGRSLASSSGD